ncbi:MAG: tetratricopeptide repeat protein [Gemmatimonadaceae bacterium]
MGAATRPTFEERSESVFGWVNDHWRQLLGGAAVLAALAGGVALWDRSQGMKSERGERALLEAQRSVQSGNLPLAQSDLQRVVDRFGGTPAEARARIVLAQVLYDQGKFGDGIAKVEPATHSKTEGAPAEALVATGYEEQGKFKEAAEHYARAATLAAFDVDRATYRASAARAYAQAGNAGAAKQIWSELAQDEESPLAAEARVRLGELSATTENKS